MRHGIFHVRFYFAIAVLLRWIRWAKSPTWFLLWYLIFVNIWSACCTPAFWAFTCECRITCFYKLVWFEQMDCYILEIGSRIVQLCTSLWFRAWRCGICYAWILNVPWCKKYNIIAGPADKQMIEIGGDIKTYPYYSPLSSKKFKVQLRALWFLEHVFSLPHNWNLSGPIKFVIQWGIRRLPYPAISRLWLL